MRGAASRDRPALDIAVSHALLQQVAKGGSPAVARLYRPALPTLAFGRLDRRSADLPAAAEAARRHGFHPLVRLAGGTAAAYHRRSLVFETISAEDGLYGRVDRRYREAARLLRAALADVGVAVALGELPGEYCAGRFSLNVAGRIKVAGIAQRVVHGAALTSAVVLVGDGRPVRRVLIDVNRILGLDFDPATAGALEDVLPGIRVADVERALTARLAERSEIVPAAVGPTTLTLARGLLVRHESEVEGGDR